MAFSGSCHCGNIRFEVEDTLASVTECNCSHCSRKGYLLWFVPRSAVSLKCPPESLGPYTFNKHFIKHHFCPKCGCVPLGFGASKGFETAAINVRCLEDVDLSRLERKFFDGRAL